MSAYFRWDAPPKRRTKIGDRKVVARILWWPKEINGQVRWLGVERIETEAYMGWVCPPEMKPYQSIKWRDVAWADDEPRYTITEAGRKALEERK